MSKQLRSGYTTGACAAAGVKAALLYEQHEEWDNIELRALDGTELVIPVKDITSCETGLTAEVVKFSGDDPDITNGVSVYTTIRHLKGAPPKIVFKAGKGIGTVTKPGLSVPVGEPSINPGPRKLICSAVAEVLGTDKIPLEVTISIPAGVELARQTLNPILGVEGGISVIGTTGVLRPMSEAGFKNSLVPQIDVAKAAGYKSLIFVPGKIGERLAAQWKLPNQAMVQTSNFIGFMLEAAQQRGVARVLLFGHIGKLIKVAAGCFYTHNRIADGRLETMAAYAAAAGLDTAGTQAILEANTTEDALAVLDKAGLKARVCQVLAQRASLRAQRYLFQKMQVGTVMVTLTGELLGMDETARDICRELGGEVLDGQAE
ncbi:MAG: cobalt-precorrin-5B (C(1))-methyltransferase CbiD [Selenomonas sp.]|uniref:cobalt-precorrin-5B (C(1))-methyltransferase CbiD n=1 Tax=Selenomonas sp. TaxID=2053611 RepID=UPI0025FD2232|nr:cobalt-precorrin-5B (C(1))-methyltransferase CbiD [Selenomonas sp.]MCR5758555.1 cobalt-precorrin-5B (C(1))-methyltransferase CbiD [Selenomonas sp.]